MRELLIVAATERELCGHDGLVCGIGPVEAAASVARALTLDRPGAVLHVGLAGGRGLEPAALVIGAEAVYCDLSAATRVVGRVLPEPTLVAVARSALPEARLLPVGTSAAVSGPCGEASRDIDVEAMEGFAVLRACELAGVPAVEVRAISNELGEADRSLWSVDEALQSLAAALPRLLDALGR